MYNTVATVKAGPYDLVQVSDTLAFYLCLDSRIQMLVLKVLLRSGAKSLPFGYHI